MSVLFLIPLCATSFGGAIALGALFHYVNGAGRRLPKPSSKRDESSSTSAALIAELDRRERSLAEIDAELDAKRAALESLTRRATEAAATLGRVLDSFSTTFGDSVPSCSPKRSTTFEPFRPLDVDLRPSSNRNV